MTLLPAALVSLEERVEEVRAWAGDLHRQEGEGVPPALHATVDALSLLVLAAQYAATGQWVQAGAAVSSLHASPVPRLPLLALNRQEAGEQDLVQQAKWALAPSREAHACQCRYHGCTGS